MSKSLYYLYDGTLIAYFTDSRGNTYDNNIFMKGGLAGTMVSALLGKPSEFTTQTLFHCKIKAQAILT